jgi:hypothetical protein
LAYSHFACNNLEVADSNLPDVRGLLCSNAAAYRVEYIDNTLVQILGTLADKKTLLAGLSFR